MMTLIGIIGTRIVVYFIFYTADIAIYRKPPFFYYPLISLRATTERASLAHGFL